MVCVCGMCVVWCMCAVCGGVCAVSDVLCVHCVVRMYVQCGVCAYSVVCVCVQSACGVCVQCVWLYVHFCHSAILSLS